METSNLVGMLTIASDSPRMANPAKSSDPFKLCGHQPYLWNGWSSQALST